ncbi:MAG: hypothetical protein Q4D44_07780 [Eubacteriales bacterium]|nr:hypothetical protein [Eubacteriales bacterium]
MAENLDSMSCNPCDENTECSKCQAVCIDAMRVYDSCGDKDCLSDLKVYFTDCAQCIIDTAVSVRIRDAQVISVLMDLESVPFHKGFYSVDMTYFFEICLDVFTSPGSNPTTVNGLSIFNKKVILYGSEGSVKVFSSIYTPDEMDIQNCPSKNLPLASVKVAKPIALSAKLCEGKSFMNPPCKIPRKICECFGGEFVPPTNRSVTVSLGVFSIVQIERNVQMLVNSYDYCIPEKECKTSSDNPCEVFSRLEFPTDEFFPPNVGDNQSDCGCCKH